MIWVTGTRLAAPSLAVVPVVRSTPITVVTFNVLPARTGSRLPVAVAPSRAALGLLRPRYHTGAA